MSNNSGGVNRNLSDDDKHFHHNLNDRENDIRFDMIEKLDVTLSGAKEILDEIKHKHKAISFTLDVQSLSNFYILHIRSQIDNHGPLYCVLQYHQHKHYYADLPS